MAISSRITLLGALALWAFQAQAVDVTVAYQTSAEPAKVAQADNTFAKESGAKVDWRKFDSGASVVRALASGDVQIGIVVSGEGCIRCGENALPVKQGSEVFFPCQVRDAVFEGDFSVILCNPGITAEYK